MTSNDTSIWRCQRWESCHKLVIDHQTTTMNSISPGLDERQQARILVKKGHADPGGNLSRRWINPRAGVEQSLWANQFQVWLQLACLPTQPRTACKMLNSNTFPIFIGCIGRVEARRFGSTELPGLALAT